VCTWLNLCFNAYCFHACSSTVIQQNEI
jgi:hypothetical protein